MAAFEPPDDGRNFNACFYFFGGPGAARRRLAL